MANHSFWKTLNKRKQFPAIMNFNNNNNNNNSNSSNNDNNNNTNNNNNNIDNNNKIGNLEKKTGLFDLCGIGIVCTFGIGAFILIGYISKYITGPSIILSIGIAAAVAVLSGLFYAELGSRISNSSTYTYSYICIGEFIAFVTGWNLILEYVIGVATVSKGISLYLDILLNDTLKVTFIDIAPIQWTFLSNYFDFLALVIPIVAAFALIIGLKKTTPINIIICVLGVGATLAIIIICIFRGDTINWISEPEINEFIDNAGFFPFGADGMIKGIAIVMFIFIFMDCYTLSNVRISQPHRTMPMSQLVIIISITLLIFGIATSQTFLYSYKFQDENVALPQILIDLNMSAMFWIITIFGIVFMCISLFGLIQPIPIILMSMADDGLIFKIFTKKNLKSNTPIFGICTFSILAGVFAGLFNIGQLINLLSIGTLFAFIVMAISILIVRYSTELHYESTTTIDINENVNNRILKNDKVTGFSFIMELFSCHCKSAPTKTSQVLFKTLLYILCIFSLGLALMFRFAYDNLRNLESWAMGLAETFLVIIILSALGISLRPRQKQYSRVSSFIVPLVPLLPAISILINMYLILILDVYAWIRFGVWMIIGIPMYLICTINKRNELTNKDKQFKEENVNNGFIADDIVIVKNNENTIVIEEDKHLSGQRIKLKDDNKIIDAIDENLQNHIIELNSGEVEELEVVESDDRDNLKTKSIKKHRAPLPFVDKQGDEDVIISPPNSPSEEYGKMIKENDVTEVNIINEQHQQHTATTSVNDIVMESFEDLNEITGKKEPNGKIYFIEETKNEPIILLGSTSNQHHIDLNAEKDEKTAIALLDDILKTEDSYPKSPDETSIDSLPVLISSQQSVTAEVHKEQDDNFDKFEKPQTPILLQRKHNEPLSLIIANDKMNINDVNDNNNNNNNKSPISPAFSDTDDLTSGNTQKFKDKLTLLIRQITPHEPIRKIFQIEDDSMMDKKIDDDTNNSNADFMSSSLISKSANDLSSNSINTANNDDDTNNNNNNNNQRNYATLPISTQHNQINRDAIPPAPKFDPILYKTIGAKYDHKHYDRPNIHQMAKPIHDHQQHESEEDHHHDDVVIRKTSRDKHHDDHKDVDRDSIGKITDPEDNHSVQLNRMTSIKDKLELILQRGPPNRYSRPKSNKTHPHHSRESDSSSTNTDDEQNRRQSGYTKSANITNDMQSDDSNRKKTNAFDYETVNFKEARKPFDTVHKQKVLFNDVLKSINADTRPSLIRSNSPKRTPKPTSIESARQALKPIKQQSSGESIDTKDNNNS